MKMSMMKQGQKSPAEIENLIKFTYCLEASLSHSDFAAPIQACKQHFFFFSEIITLAH